MNEFNLKGKRTWDPWYGFNECKFSKDSSLFSSSLPVFRDEKQDVNDHVSGYSLADDFSSSFKNHPDIKHFEANDHHAIESRHPDDDDEFIAGITNGLDFDSDEYDLFGSGGGLEFESDAEESLKFELPIMPTENGTLLYSRFLYILHMLCAVVCLGYIHRGLSEDAFGTV